MINALIGGFVAILVGVILVGPISVQVMSAASTTNSTGGTCTAYDVNGTFAGASSSACNLYMSSSWGATVLRMVPGFFALGIMGIGIAVCYSSLREAGIV
jgi:hypothetical protein